MGLWIRRFEVFGGRFFRGGYVFRVELMGYGMCRIEMGG